MASMTASDPRYHGYGFAAVPVRAAYDHEYIEVGWSCPHGQRAFLWITPLEWRFARTHSGIAAHAWADLLDACAACRGLPMPPLPDMAPCDQRC